MKQKIEFNGPPTYIYIEKCPVCKRKVKMTYEMRTDKMNPATTSMEMFKRDLRALGVFLDNGKWVCKECFEKKITVKRIKKRKKK